MIGHTGFVLLRAMADGFTALKNVNARIKIQQQILMRTA